MKIKFGVIFYYKLIFICLFSFHFQSVLGQNTPEQRRKKIIAVSLDPSASEIICALNKEHSIVGVYKNATYPSVLAKKRIAGSIRFPNKGAIDRLKPNVLFISSKCVTPVEQLKKESHIIIRNDIRSISDIFKSIRLIGRFYNCDSIASQLIDSLNYNLNIISKNLNILKEKDRKKVVNCVGFSDRNLFIANEKTLSYDIINAAGGLPLKRKEKESIIKIPYEEFIELNTDVIVLRKSDSWISDSLKSAESKTNTTTNKGYLIIIVPDELLDFPSVRINEIISYISIQLYPDIYKSIRKWQQEGVLISRQDLGDIDIPYVRSARAEKLKRFGSVMSSLIIEFTQPLEVMSTLHGPLSNISVIGNTYLSKHHWFLDNSKHIDSLKSSICKIHYLPLDFSVLLFTGASIENMAFAHEMFDSLSVYAFITAGVKSNPIRTSITSGGFYEPGTINIIILTNMKLSRSAQASAIITATEAKTAVLQELDIRADPNRIRFQATGTGADNIIIAGGQGPAIVNFGGHTKVSELIAKSVRTALMEAIFKQNGIFKGRPTVHRLAERNITSLNIVNNSSLPNLNTLNIEKQLDSVFIIPLYSEFIAQSLALDDAHTNHLISKKINYEIKCIEIAETLAGNQVNTINNFFSSQISNNYLDMSINAILTGLIQKNISNSSLSNSKEPFFLRLEKNFLDINNWFTAIIEKYPLSNQMFRDSFFNEVNIENSRNKDYVNLNTIMVMALNTDKYLFSNSEIPFYNSSYTQNPNQFTIDEYIGRTIAHIINSTKGADEYEAITNSFPDILSDLRPLARHMALGYIGGVLSIINPRLNIIRTQQIIEYGPAKKEQEKQTFYMPEGSTQLSLLELSKTVDFKESENRGKYVNGIQGIFTDIDKQYYWLSNINSIHFFNIAPEDYILQHNDTVHWYYGRDTGDERTK